MKTTIFVLVATAAVCLVPSMMLADTMTYNGVGLHETVTTHIPGMLADNLTVYAGQEYLQYHNVNYTGYCVDLNQYAATAGDFSVIPVTSLPRGQQIAYLYNTYGPLATTDEKAAALGVAIWELTAETNTTLNATNGLFWIANNAAVAADANALLATVPASYNSANMPFILHSPTAQDFVTCNAVPEPATLAMLAVGGLALFRRKIK